MPTYDERARNYQQHGAANMQSRDELRRRGVPEEHLPTWDTRNSTRERVMNEPAPRRSAPVNSINSSAELDELARAQGFNSYEEMMLWNRRRQDIDGSSPAAPTPAPTATPTPQPQQSGGIGGIFDYIARVMSGGQ